MQRIEKQEKEFLETERWQIEALTRDIEQSRAELKKQEDDFKSQLKEKEDEILRVSNQRNEQQAKFEACSSEIERLQRNYDADMEKLKVVIKKQYNIESTLRSELKVLHDTITKIETDKRLKLEELKKKHDEIGKIQEKVVDKQKQDIETLQVTNKKLTEDGINKESEVQDTRDQLQKVKDKLAKNMEEKDEVIASLQQAVEVRSETVSQMKQALDQQMMRANEQLEAKQKQIDQLAEKLQVEEALSAIYKHDFETERNDQRKLHQSFIDLQAHCEYLKQKLTEEEKFINAQGKYHELQKHEHYKLIAPMTDEVEKTKGELMKAKEQLSSLTKEKKRLEKRIKELEQGETERVIEIEQEMQALTTQVNAYSREVDKQKGLVAQNQEKHKTEVIQLQEKLKREMKSKDNELARMRQQLAHVSANKEELLTAYHEEQTAVTRLQDQIEKMRKANKVLMEKVKAYQCTTPVIDTLRLSPSVRKPQHPLPPSIAERPGFTIAPVVQSDGDGMLVVSKTEGVTPSHHTDSDSVPEDIPAFMSKEEMARMFKSHNQQGSSDWTQSPQQVKDSSLAAQKVQPTEESLVAEQKRQELARKADDALLEVDRMRRQADLKQKPVHQQTNNDSDTQDESRPKGQLTKEIEEMADEVRKASRGPNTDEVIFNDDPNDDRPYDPNLVCPRCGKQYRVGEIQKLRRHINEFCTGIR